MAGPDFQCVNGAFSTGIEAASKFIKVYEDLGTPLPAVAKNATALTFAAFSAIIGSALF